jgi:hypothetical protein
VSRTLGGFFALECKAKEAVSQPPFVIASDRRERGNPTRRVVASPKGVAISCPSDEIASRSLP